jgi:hypothetical protein
MSHDLECHSHTSLKVICVVAMKSPQTRIVEYNSEDRISSGRYDKRIPERRCNGR